MSYRLKCYIITNDKYRQYVGTPLEDWLNKILTPFKIVDGKFNLVPKKKIGAIGKDIDKLKAKYFEVKAPLRFTSFVCSECGAMLNITSK